MALVQDDTSIAHLSLRSVLVFYGLTLVVALIWDGWGEGSSELILLVPETLGRDAALGIGSGVLIVVATRVGRRVSQKLRDLEDGLQQILGRLTPLEIFACALCSGVGEEVLFRGAMQPDLGLAWTAFLFGLLHGGYIGRWWLWSLFALVIGFVFGWMFEYTSNLAAPILAHFTVNLLNLHALAGRR